MNWIIDQIPWYVWALLLGGGGAAVFAFVPGALALVLGVWNALPGWARWVLGGAVVAALAYFKGRNVGRDNAEADQRRLDDKARDTAKEVNREVNQLDDKEVDDKLGKGGGYWDDRRKP